MFTSHDLAWGIAAPALISAIALLLCWRSRLQLPSSIGVAGVAIGFIVAYSGITRRSPVPPHEAQDWLNLLAGWCLLFAVIDSQFTIPSGVRLAACAATFLAIGWL